MGEFDDNKENGYNNYSDMNNYYGQNNNGSESNYQTNYSNMSTRDYMDQMAGRAGNNYVYNEQVYHSDDSISGHHDKRVKPAKQHKEKKKSGKSTSFVKRGIAVVASAAVFGGVAGGVFNYISGDNIRALSNGTTAETELEAAASDVASSATTESSNENAIVPTVNVQSDESTDGQNLDVSDIAAGVMPSIVAINIKTVEEVQNFFGQVQQYEAEGSGSGIIIGQNDTELLIVTNNHVVSSAETVSVGFIDNQIYEAKVKSTDSDNDLAIVVVELKDLSDDTLSQIKVAQLGNSDELKVGEQVVAIGNALGYGQSVTTGIVSALDRETEMNATPLIQTDAAINPGNSGGALLNMNGEVIGINSSKYSSTDVEGMCYAIPISAVQDNIDSLMSMKTREKVDEDKRGYLGIACGGVSEEASQTYGIPVGVIITEVYDGSGAADAGLKKNYIITKFDGQSVSSAEDLTDKLQYYAKGEKVEITYKVLEDDEYVEKTTIVTLGEKVSN